MKNSDNMFYGAQPVTFEKGKMLRSNMNIHEKLLWEELKSNKLRGLRFKAQHPIDTFIVDFYCHKLKIAIEVDGTSHTSEHQIEYDKGRTYSMEQCGLNVLRFTNDEIEINIEQVINSIKVTCQDLASLITLSDK